MDFALFSIEGFKNIETTVLFSLGHDLWLCDYTFLYVHVEIFISICKSLTSVKYSLSL